MRHLEDAIGRLANLERLPAGGLGELGGGSARRLRALGNCGRGVVDIAYDAAQPRHGIVDRLGDGARHLVRETDVHRQVAIGQRLELVEQLLDGTLVAPVAEHRVSGAPPLRGDDRDGQQRAKAERHRQARQAGTQ